MTMRNALFAAVATVVTLSNAAIAATPQEEAAHRAHDRYLAAINANDLDVFLATVTDDIVFIAPNSPVMIGKAEVGPWVRGYFEAVQTAWQKTSVEFVVTGDWAFERYIYTAVDTPHDGGAPYIDTGNGINIYRAGTDGVWRVARDVWATDRSLTKNAEITALATCTGASGPCQGPAFVAASFVLTRNRRRCHCLEKFRTERHLTCLMTPMEILLEHFQRKRGMPTTWAFTGSWAQSPEWPTPSKPR